MKFGLDDIDEWLEVFPDRSRLDGRFTAEQLRRIADKMDELKKAAETNVDGKTCRYCDNPPTKGLVWLKDKYGQPVRITVLWCGCDLQTALKKFWSNPYTVREGIDYEVVELTD
jgi:hypothetical protein